MIKRITFKAKIIYEEDTADTNEPTFARMELKKKELRIVEVLQPWSSDGEPTITIKRISKIK